MEFNMNREKLKGHIRHFLTVAICIGGAMMALDQKEWDSWWWMKKAGWVLLLLGNVFNTMKAFYSNSSQVKD
jgi:hypothetical protein